MADKHGVLVVDFGAQYAQLIARRVREANVYSEIVPSSITADEVSAKNPEAIILSGGPSSVYADHAPKVDPAIFALGIPVFGICYGFQTMAAALAGVVAQTGKSEFGRTPLKVTAGSKMFAGLPATQSVWMSHGDAVSEVPCGFSVTASTSDTPIAAFEDASGKLAGVQFHPEVLHSEHGQAILKNWLINIAGCKPTWTTHNIAEDEVAKAREVIGNKRVICGLSGGVDSSVAAALLVEAGHEVVGVWMRLHSAADQRDGHRKSCCTLDAADDARRVADHLGIPFHIQNLEQEFADAVLEPFVAAYQSGETPSPCVGCNTAVKFGALVGKGSALFGCDAVATGHYARRAVSDDGLSWRLRAAVDSEKDQTYFLHQLGVDRKSVV